MTFQQFLAEKNREHTVVVSRPDLLRQVKQLGLAHRQSSATHDEITGPGETFRLPRTSTVTITIHWEVEQGARHIIGTPHFLDGNVPAGSSAEERLLRHFAQPATLVLPEPVVFDEDDYERGGSGWVFRPVLIRRLQAQLECLQSL